MLPSQTHRSLAVGPQPSLIFSSSSHIRLRSPCLDLNPSPLPFSSLHIFSGSFLRPASVQKRSPITASCSIPRTDPAKRMSVTAEMERFAEVANTVADAAGEVLRKYFRQSFEIIDKEDLSTCVHRLLRLLISYYFSFSFSPVLVVRCKRMVLRRPGDDCR